MANFGVLELNLNGVVTYFLADGPIVITILYTWTKEAFVQDKSHYSPLITAPEGYKLSFICRSNREQAMKSIYSVGSFISSLTTNNMARQFFSLVM